ncbi:7095_t:CDS:10 [Funneliformis geosporum]|uniref:7589_t:CDS:1 n=1 Tax=Funneliformis geosporum TaxID=1117311 RepID=A0A9W4WJW5_9GLOM|nr:7095_t:CDS:10 [Funneliformis geosporum]CAI2167061.1 7589_t:CDS:10 [Funneliformis geosporum]
MSDKLTRIAIVSSDKCKPKKCRQECKKSCPVVRMGKLCIEVSPDSKIAFISEELCIGCGICPKKCPFGAIMIINLPTNLEKEVTHRYSANSFKLHRLPVPRPGQVLGLVGTNGIGKSTALKILAGKLKPNLGKFEDPPDWQDILKYFRGSELQNYFTKILEDNLKAIIKPQYVDHIPKAVKGTVTALIDAKLERDNKKDMISALDLQDVLNRQVIDLSGGELQRFAIAVVCIQKADIYVIVVEHDLSVLDYLSDFICVLYGMPSVYGVVTMPFSVREGINIFLDGKVPTENLRFREESLTFKLAETAEDEKEVEKHRIYKYPDMTKTLGDFHLTVKSGGFTDSEIIVMLGENGTGKTTFIKLLAGGIKADGDEQVPELNVSYKPQKISPKYPGTVRSLFIKKIKNMFMHQQFQTDVVKPMQIENIIDQEVASLSGGELQRVAIVLALGQPADIYLIDEPSAYLDSEQRVVAAKKTAFVVEHDFIMATYLADRVVVYEGSPSVKATANTPQSLLSGMNKFLGSLEITFRRDPTNFRPRINKADSMKDKEQKSSSVYSQKIVWALAIKKLQWTSVIVPQILPRPLLQPLTHGYRRIPVLQIGSDIFVDSASIIEELERRYPEPTLFPKRNGSDKSDRGLGLSMAMWTDRYFIPAILGVIPFFSKDPSTPKIFTSKEFKDDRASLFGIPINTEKLLQTRPYFVDQIKSNFEWVELQFSDDDREWFLDTPYPSISDIHVASNIWFLDVTQGAKEISYPNLYPKTYSWFNRFLKYVKSSGIKPNKISGEEALEIAKKYKPLNGGERKVEQDQKDATRKLGDNVIIQPDDYGKVPVKGKIVSLGDRIIGIRPHDVDKTGFEVVIWFPRAGYRIKPDNGKL